MTEIPIRSQFVASPNHYLLQLDLSQAETWCVAYLANEVNMKDYLIRKIIHEMTASAIFNTPVELVTKIQRFLGKKGNHSLSYKSSIGMLVKSINAESDKPPYVTVSYKEGKIIYDGWHSLYNLRTWHSEIESILSNSSRTLVTPYGRTRTFYAQWGEEMFKEAIAYVPQSTVADHLNGAIQPELGIKGGLIEVHRQFHKTGAIRLTNQSHDSFICECPRTSYKEIAEQLYNLIHRPLVINGETFTIPVDCEYGERFGELEKMNL